MLIVFFLWKTVEQSSPVEYIEENKTKNKVQSSKSYRLAGG
jgi:hypothetical protein